MKNLIPLFLVCALLAAVQPSRAQGLAPVPQAGTAVAIDNSSTNGLFTNAANNLAYGNAATAITPSSLLPSFSLPSFTDIWNMIFGMFTTSLPSAATPVSTGVVPFPTQQSVAATAALQQQLNAQMANGVVSGVDSTGLVCSD